MADRKVQTKGWNWDDLSKLLPQAVEAPKTGPANSGLTLDKIPAFVRDRVEESYKAYATKTVRDRKTKQDRQVPDPAWRLQKFQTPEQAEQFVKLAKAYAKVRPDGPVTFRKGGLDGNTLRYTVKPLETKPGSKS